MCQNALLASITLRTTPTRRTLPCSFSWSTSNAKRLQIHQAIWKLRCSSTAPKLESRLAEGDKNVSEQSSAIRKSSLDDAVAEETEKQTKAPWHREGSDIPPVARQRSAGAMVKGKLLTTPSRLLKLILPLTTLDKNSDRKDVEPLALLVHPQQPLSYLERLIQSELPLIKTEKGHEKIPSVHFKAEESQQVEIQPKTPNSGEKATNSSVGNEEQVELEKKQRGSELERDEKVDSARNSADQSPNLGEGSVESYSGLGHERSSADGEERRFVRWSPSTEIGDFIQDAARGKEFAIVIEGAANEVRIGVPSFNDRTHYLRMRLRKISSKISQMAGVKRECDVAAHKTAQRVAIGGAGLLVGYWYTVYRLTFETDLGWDTMEPVTYLVGLSTLICGYLWFLYHNREVSYRAALNLTISRRQTKLYQARGFDLPKWELLVEEGNALRKEIKLAAREYDIDWDETQDEKDDKVKEALRQDRMGKKAKEKEKKEDGDE